MCINPNAKIRLGINLLASGYTDLSFFKTLFLLKVIVKLGKVINEAFRDLDQF